MSNILPPGSRAPAPPYLGKGAIRLGVHADGSCLFHAIVAALTGKVQSKEVGIQYREHLVTRATREQHLEAWKLYSNNTFTPSEEEYSAFIRKLKNPRTFSDAYTIPYVMAKENINLLFATDEGLYCGMHYWKGDRWIIIYWDRKNEHFEPVGRVGGFSKDEIREIYFKHSCPQENFWSQHMGRGSSSVYPLTA